MRHRSSAPTRSLRAIAGVIALLIVLAGGLTARAWFGHASSNDATVPISTGTPQPPGLPEADVAQTLSGWRERLGAGDRLDRTHRESIRAEVRAALEGTGAEIERLRFFGGSPQPGVEIEMRTATPALTLLKVAPLVHRFYTSKSGILGAFVLRDASGQTVWNAGYSGNEGFVGTRADLDSCSPISHSQPVAKPGYAVPACPATLDGSTGLRQ